MEKKGTYLEVDRVTRTHTSLDLPNYSIRMTVEEVEVADSVAGKEGP